MPGETARYDGMDVEILDREEHRGYEALQVQALADDRELSDPSGNPPWVPAEEVVSDD